MQRINPNNQFEADDDAGNNEPSITDLLNANSKSLLLNFPRIPIDRPAYGGYEMNGRFSYAFSQDFDKNLISVLFKIYNFIKSLFIRREKYTWQNPFFLDLLL